MIFVYAALVLGFNIVPMFMPPYSFMWFIMLAGNAAASWMFGTECAKVKPRGK